MSDYSGLNGRAIEKYLLKQNHAKELKEQAALHAQKVFASGRNWTPSITKPQMPNITDAHRT